MPKLALAVPILTPEQKALVAQHWQLDLGDLTRLVFKDDKLDRRSIECKAVRIELALSGRGNARAPLPTYSEDLSPEHQEYIRNNFKNASPLEMARTLSGDEKLMISSVECRRVEAFCRMIDPTFRNSEELAEGPYQPPTTIVQLLSKVNKYAINPRHDGKPLYDSDHLSNQDQKQLRSLMAYMKTPLFKIEGDKYLRKTDRELFESTMISFCWNKPELMAEEVHQYIAVSAETVKYTQIDRTVQKLDERLNSVLESPDSSMKMADVELLNSMREKSNASMAKIAALIKALVGARAERLKNKIESSASMHNLVEAWQKEDDRRRIIQIAMNKQRAELTAEVERLSDMDSLKGEIFGLNKVDILR